MAYNLLCLDISSRTGGATLAYNLLCVDILLSLYRSSREGRVVSTHGSSREGRVLS